MPDVALRDEQTEDEGGGRDSGSRLAPNPSGGHTIYPLTDIPTSHETAIDITTSHLTNVSGGVQFVYSLTPFAVRCASHALDLCLGCALADAWSSTTDTHSDTQYAFAIATCIGWSSRPRQVA